MLRPRKPDGSAEEVEPTLIDIAKALTLLTTMVNAVHTTLNDQIENHKKEVVINAQNHKDLKQELADIKVELNRSQTELKRLTLSTRSKLSEPKSLRTKFKNMSWKKDYTMS